MRPVAVPLACLCLLAAGCGGGAKNDKPSSSGAEPKPEETAPAIANGCGTATPAKPKDVGAIKKPTETLDASKTYVATVSTSCGDFQITLDAKRAPKTGGSFKYLADQKFFDGTSFHR